MDSTINILSYNSTGCDSDKVNFINNLVSDMQIHLFSLQEHFKATKSVESFFRKQFPNYHSLTRRRFAQFLMKLKRWRGTQNIMI